MEEEKQMKLKNKETKRFPSLNSPLLSLLVPL